MSKYTQLPGTTATTGYRAALNQTTKMDKNFDFSSFLAKKFVMSDTPQVSETNRIDDPEFKQGFLKTVIMAGNGIFEVVRSKYGFSVKNQSADYPGLGDIYDSLASGCFVTENPAPKLPRKAVETVIEWYKRITAKNGEEAQVVFYWNQYKNETVKDDDGVEHVIKDIPGVHFWTDELFSYTPKQYNSGALTEVADEDEWYDVFNRNFGMYVETHSHNSMDAFASGTDEENSTNDGFQLVFGRLNTQTPVMYSWMTMNRVMRLGMKEDELAKIMEVNPSSRYDQALEKVIYNTEELDFDESLFAEWDKQVVKCPAPKYTTIAGATNYYGYDYSRGTTGTTGKTTTTAYGNYTYAAFNDEQLENALETEFDNAIGASIVHQCLRAQKEKIDYDDVVNMMKKAFVAGYYTKKDGPYTLNNNTYERFAVAVDENVSDILEQFYDVTD